MAALETKVLLRLIVGDDPKQEHAAQKLVASEPCAVAPSVLLECERVLRGSCKVDVALIAASFRDLLTLQNTDALDPVLTQQALQAYEAGLDFADAWHAAQRRDGERFVTSERQLARRAPKAAVLAGSMLKT